MLVVNSVAGSTQLTAIIDQYGGVPVVIYRDTDSIRSQKGYGRSKASIRPGGRRRNLI